MVLVEVDDLDIVIDVVERYGIIRPVELVVIDGALVMAVNKLARAGQRIDLAGIDLLADLLDQDPDVVALGFIENRVAILEFGHRVPAFLLPGTVKSGPRVKLAR